MSRRKSAPSGCTRARPACRLSATASRKPTGNFLSALRMDLASSPLRNRSASSSSTARSRWKSSAKKSGKSSNRPCRKSDAGERACRIYGNEYCCIMNESTLNEIEAKIRGADKIGDERKRELLQLLATLKTEVGALS